MAPSFAAALSLALSSSVVIYLYGQDNLLMYISLPVYVVEVLLFVTVGFISFSSRLLPWRKVKTFVQIIAIIGSCHLSARATVPGGATSTG